MIPSTRHIFSILFRLGHKRNFNYRTAKHYFGSVISYIKSSYMKRNFQIHSCVKNKCGFYRNKINLDQLSHFYDVQNKIEEIFCRFIIVYR